MIYCSQRQVFHLKLRLFCTSSKKLWNLRILYFWDLWKTKISEPYSKDSYSEPLLIIRNSGHQALKKLCASMIYFSDDYFPYKAKLQNKREKGFHTWHERLWTKWSQFSSQGLFVENKLSSKDLILICCGFLAGTRGNFRALLSFHWCHMLIKKF